MIKNFFLFFFLSFVTLLGDETFVVGFSQDTLSNDWRLAQVQQFKTHLLKHKEVSLLIKDAGGSIAQQVMDIEDLIDEGVDVLVVSPGHSGAVVGVLKQAHEKAIPIVLLDRSIDADFYTTFIHPSNIEITKQVAKQMIKHLNASGSVVMLKGVPHITPTKHRTDYFLKGIEAHKNITVVKEATANFLRADAFKAMNTILEEGIAFDAIYSQSDSMAVGARKALLAHGISPKSKVIIGIDFIQSAKNAIKNGEQTVSFTYPTCGEEGAQAVIKVLNNEAIAKDIEVPSIMVTRENVDDVQAIF
ncbi:MAG: substrate-binding domain-containing protein [Campylobacterota bacterium]|nr:substrate-binding domain-containing protein [Campylobacterota bacterium]